MDGRAIAAGALGDAGLRRLSTELAGPRPTGTAAGARPERGAAARPEAAGATLATRP